MENLKLMLYAYDSKDPLYFGFRYRKYLKQGYMAGTSYVLSKEALTRFATDINETASCNRYPGIPEDVAMGMCLEQANVVAGDSRDDRKAERFVPLTPFTMISSQSMVEQSWFKNFTYYKFNPVS